MKKVGEKQAVILLIILLIIGGMVLFGKDRKAKQSELLMKIYEPTR